MQISGLHIGGAGIKGAPVESETGVLVAVRFRIPAPQPATPEACAAAIRPSLRHFNHRGPVGSGFPGVPLNGVVKATANLQSRGSTSMPQHSSRGPPVARSPS